jgi:hypothetical protein
MPPRKTKDRPANCGTAMPVSSANRPTPATRPWLVKRLAWRLEVLAEGDLSERARQRAAQLANDADLRLSAPLNRRPRRARGQSAEKA